MLTGMKWTVLIAALAFAAPAVAQDDGVEEGVDLLSEGTRMLLRGLMDEIEPALRELRGALQDLDAYEAPEILPNGDIIIRRKEPLDPGDVEIPEGGIEL